ncbi:hypothetical protein MLD38_010709 [Melastoma candidum]|uniref:Uncharacterized protein n=1 Tax=Melastoma candidum TaxID=119954 RepID=A0ACB9R928_9MYRT|nr:hypothetical protein MLD38_010709 [Melastoma candidum]
MDNQYQILKIKLISANDLETSHRFALMGGVYVEVALSGGDPEGGLQKFKTHVDRQGVNNPTWNFPMKFRVGATALEQSRPTLTFALRCNCAHGDVDVGTVVVPVKELYDAVVADCGKATSMSTQIQFITLPVRKPLDKPKGALYFSYKFGEIKRSAYADVAAEAAVPSAYTAGTSAGNMQQTPPDSSCYPPSPPPAYTNPHQPYAQNAHGGYPPVPPPPPYDYPPIPPPGYMYQQPQQSSSQENQNQLWLGLTAGCLGGMLVLLLIRSPVSENDIFNEGYNVGYDAGYDDAGGLPGWIFLILLLLLVVFLHRKFTDDAGGEAADQEG